MSVSEIRFVAATSREWFVLNATAFFLGAVRAAPCLYLDPRGSAAASVTRGHEASVLANKETNRDAMTMTKATAKRTAPASAAALQRGDNRQSTAFVTLPHLPSSIS
ncbi:MAG TPA: hypothetical protein VN280_23300 [Variovorax sp.]|nr:hypothetical protein [Variovorax sp.]